MTAEPADTEPVAITAAITLDGVRYSHTEGVLRPVWDAATDDFRDQVRDQARARLGLHLAEHLPITLTDTSQTTAAPRTPGNSS